MSGDITSTAIPERCAECGGTLGSVRRLMEDAVGIYRPVHFTCAHAYRWRVDEIKKQPAWAPSDTSARPK